MMKLLTSLLLLASSANAFAPIGVPAAARASSSQLNVSMKKLTEIAQNSGQEAIKVKVMACDNQECAMIDGWKDNSGRWCFAEPSDASETWKNYKGEYTYKILMYEIDDVE